jgi:aspartate kinase
MAKKYNIELEVLSSLTKAPGTIVKETKKMEKMLISGVAKDTDVARISIIGVPDKPGLAFKLFSKLSAKNINVDIILQSIGHDGTKDISFTIAKDRVDEAKACVQDYIVTIGAKDMSVNTNVAKISIVGAGMESHAGVATKMFEALYDAHININMIATSEIKISVLIDVKDADRAVEAIHDKFFES